MDGFGKDPKQMNPLPRKHRGQVKQGVHAVPSKDVAGHMFGRRHVL